MSKALYLGVSGVARKVSQPNIGVSSVARKVKNGYLGVSGVARLFYSGGYTWDKYSVKTSYNHNKVLKSQTGNFIYYFATGSLDSVSGSSFISTGVSKDYSGNGNYPASGTVLLCDSYECQSDDAGVIFEGTYIIYPSYKSNNLPSTGLSYKYAVVIESHVNSSPDMNRFTLYSVGDTVYSKGETSYGTVTSSDPNAYPDNGEQDGYWYVKRS